MTQSTTPTKPPAERPRVDGQRKRRYSSVKAKREWYAKYRALRFARHLGF